MSSPEIREDDLFHAIAAPDKYKEEVEAMSELSEEEEEEQEQEQEQGIPLGMEDVAVEAVETEYSESVTPPPRRRHRSHARAARPARGHRDVEREYLESGIKAAVEGFQDFRVDCQRDTETLEKTELMAKIATLERSGVHAMRPISDALPLEEMRYECYRMTREYRSQSALKTMRRALVSVAGGVEALNRAYDPFSLKLDGFSNNVYTNIQDYDDDMLGLHSKWASKGARLGPELSLTFSLATAALSHHVSNSISGMGSLPAVGDRGEAMNRMAGGVGLNPMSLLASVMGGNFAAPPPASRRGMSGPDSDSDE